jgi:16S rRNA (cytosine967-C5)-methyltransferase
VWDRVLVDAPCSGLGTLRRRPDARWRIAADAIERLVPLQRALVQAAAELVAPGGTITYSVCTLTAAETEGIDRWAAEALPELAPLPSLDPPWRARGRGSLLLPQDAGTDGMYVLRLRAPGRSEASRGGER